MFNVFPGRRIFEIIKCYEERTTLNTKPKTSLHAEAIKN